MARVKSIGNWLWWWLRLGIFLSAPTLFAMGLVVFLMLPYTSSANWAGVIISALLLAAIFIAWLGKPALPDGTQTDSPPAGKLGWGLFATIYTFLSAFLGLAWLHSASSTSHNFIGRTLYFVPVKALNTFVLLSVISCLLLLGMLIKCAVKSNRQYYLLAWLSAIAIALYPVAGGVYMDIGMKKLPEWQLRQTVQGPDKQTYSFLLVNPFARENNLSALVRHIIRTPFFDRVEMILLDEKTSRTHGVLVQGMKYEDATVREVCAALLKAEEEKSRRDAKNAEEKPAYHQGHEVR